MMRLLYGVLFSDHIHYLPTSATQQVASSGADEHIVILDSQTGEELMCLDDAMDGKGLTIKFSFDGTRVEIGGEFGQPALLSLR